MHPCFWVPVPQRPVSEKCQGAWVVAGATLCPTVPRAGVKARLVPRLSPPRCSGKTFTPLFLRPEIGAGGRATTQAPEQPPTSLLGGPGVPVPQKRASRGILRSRTGADPPGELGLYLGHLGAPTALLMPPAQRTPCSSECASVSGYCYCFCPTRCSPCYPEPLPHRVACTKQG